LQCVCVGGGGNCGIHLSVTEQATGTRCVSILWGAWALGMGATTGEYLELLEKVGMGAITAGVGLSALARILACACPHVVTAPPAWARLIATGRQRAAPIYAEFAMLAAAPEHMTSMTAVGSGRGTGMVLAAPEAAAPGRVGMTVEQMAGLVSQAAMEVLGVELQGAPAGRLKSVYV
jgi:hypothetical protein